MKIPIKATTRRIALLVLLGSTTPVVAGNLTINFHSPDNKPISGKLTKFEVCIVGDNCLKLRDAKSGERDPRMEVSNESQIVLLDVVQPVEEEFPDRMRSASIYFRGTSSEGRRLKGGCEMEMTEKQLEESGGNVTLDLMLAY